MLFRLETLVYHPESVGYEFMQLQIVVDTDLYRSFNKPQLSIYIFGYLATLMLDTVYVGDNFKMLVTDASHSESHAMLT